MSTIIAKNKEQYRTIDGVRTVAAIAIIAMHVLENGNYAINGYLYEKIIPAWKDFVFLFMIISAFSMCCGYYKKFYNNQISLGEFYIRRYKRIWPYFALLCILDLIISPSIEALMEVFANLTLCFGFLPNPNMSVIGVGWFLGVIFAFYIMFPFFCCLLSTKKKAWVILVVTLIFNYLCEVKFDANRLNIIYNAPFFVSGGLIFLYKEKLENIGKGYKILLAMICVMFIWIYYEIGTYTPIILILFSLILILAISNKGFILDNKVTNFISNISMELYLCHMVIYRILEKIQLTHIFENNILSYIFTSFVTVMGSIIFAIITKRALNICEKRIFIRS